MTVLDRTFEERAHAVMCAVFGAPHRWPRVHKHSKGPLQFWECSTWQDISTWDCNRLTCLVVAAHDYCVRASIVSSSPGRIKIQIHRRSAREGPIYKRHPGMNEAVRMVRLKYEEPLDIEDQQ